MAADSDRSFLGCGWGFPVEFDPVGKGARMAANIEDIRESLWILLTTNPGERTMLPDFGCGLRARVFDSINEAAITEITDLIQRAILFYEPRITLNNVQVIMREPLEGVLDIFIDYTVRTTNTRSNMVFPFYYLEATNAIR